MSYKIEITAPRLGAGGIEVRKQYRQTLLAATNLAEREKTEPWIGQAYRCEVFERQQDGWRLVATY